MRISDINPAAWIVENRIKASSGQPFDFKEHLFWYDVLNDVSPHQVWLKAAQGGGTEVAILKALWLCDRRKMDCIYTMPSQSDINTTVGTRLNRLLGLNPSLAALVKDKDSVEQKLVGDNLIHFRGCVDEQTEVLTENGWCSYGQIRKGDKLPTLNIETNTVENDTVLDMTVFQANEEMVRFSSPFIDQLVTKDHRCVISKRRLTGEKGPLRIKRAYELLGKGTANFPMVHLAPAVTPDPFYKVVGWVIGDGSYWTKRDKSTFVKKDGTVSPKVYETPQVVIIQSKFCAELEKDLQDAGVRYGKKTHNREQTTKDGHLDGWRYCLDAATARRIRSIIPEKKLTQKLVASLTQEERYGLYLGLMMSDGDNYGEQYFYQNKNGTCDAFQALCVYLGKTTNLSIRKEGVRQVVTIKKNKWVSPTPTTEEYQGIAWCPTTKNGTIFIRRNGKVSVTGQTMTERAAISVPADCLIHDEEDRSNATVLPTYASRLQHSKYKWDWHFSNPSFPGHGVDRLWQKSDQKHWFIKCPKCSEDQYLSWPDSVNFERKQFVCKKCDAEIDTQTRRAGRWVKKWEDREYSGYWISALMYPWLTAEYIIKEFQERPQDYFFNFVLGLPYIAEGSTITKETILRNCQSVVMDQKRCVIGVDVGLDCHYVVGNRNGLFYHDKTSKQEEVEGLLHRWKDSIMVIDAGPDIFFVRELRDKYPGRVYLCSFARSRPKEEIIRWGKGEESGRVLADRSRVIQLVADEFAGRRIPLQGTAHDWEPFASHAAVMYRVQELDMSGNPVYTWESSSPMNHYLLAAVYFRIGMDRFGGDVSFIQTTNIDQPPSAPTVFKGRIPSSYALDGKKIGQDEVW